jgi:hypothetical protein
VKHFAEMKSLKSLTLGTIFVLALGVSGQTAKIVKPSTDDLMERQLPGDGTDYLSTTDAFYNSLGGVGMPGGAERIVGCEQDNAKQAWSPMNKSLRQALDTIVEADPRYRWEVVDQVINLLPATGEPALLQTRISEFHVENMFSAMDALSPLLALPEVRKAMDDLHLKPGITLISSWRSPTAISVTCTNVTLRQALNAIARAHGRVAWGYIETDCAGKDEVVIRF